jgi:hypothetical protein
MHPDAAGVNYPVQDLLKSVVDFWNKNTWVAASELAALQRNMGTRTAVEARQMRVGPYGPYGPGSREVGGEERCW